MTGFIIEAAQMEGTIQSLGLATGDTVLSQNVPMLDMKFTEASTKGLVIKKIVQTPNGTVTTNISSQDTALFKNLEVKVTNAEFEGIYVSDKGKIGFKHIKLLAHYVTSTNADLSKFALHFTNGGQLKMQSQNEEELLQIETKLKQFLNISKEK